MHSYIGWRKEMMEAASEENPVEKLMEMKKRWLKELWDKKRIKEKEKAKKCLMRAMHNGERKNSLAVCREINTRHLSQSGGWSVDGNGKRMTDERESRGFRATNEDATRNGWRLDEYSILVVVVVLVVVIVVAVVVVFKPVETKTVFSCDIIHYLKRPLSLSQPS